MGRGAAREQSHASTKAKPPSRCAGMLLVNSGPLSSAGILSGLMPGQGVFSALGGLRFVNPDGIGQVLAFECRSNKGSR